MFLKIVQEDTWMNLEYLFEDLEAQFDSDLRTKLISSPEIAGNIFRVHARTGMINELVSPVLGLDFVAGIELNARVFRLIMNSNIRRIQPLELPGALLPELIRLHVSAAEFCAKLPLPLEVFLEYETGTPTGGSVLKHIVNTLLSIESADAEFLVPIETIQTIEIRTVENFSERFGPVK